MAAESIDVLEIVKARLQIEDEDKLINSYIKEIGHRIKHYCNIRTIPEGLIYAWASMVMDAVRVELANIDEIADSTDSGASIKIGDTSSGPASGSGKDVTSTSKSVIDEVVLNYRVDLNHYRRLKW